MFERMADNDPLLQDYLQSEVNTCGWACVEISNVDDISDINSFVGRLALGFSSTNIEPEIRHIKVANNKDGLAVSPRAMDLHTDNVYLENPCNTVFLYCIDQAAHGGESIIVDAKEVADSLNSAVRNELESRKWIWNNQQDRGLPCPPRSVINEYNHVRWWTTGLCNRSPEDQETALYFNQALHNSDTLRSLTLSPGQLLVVDNKRMVHGRTAFIGDRVLIRGRSW